MLSQPAFRWCGAPCVKEGDMPDDKPGLGLEAAGGEDDSFTPHRDCHPLSPDQPAFHPASDGAEKPRSKEGAVTAEDIPESVENR